MKEKPILFSGPMVQAILAGRKTQTRRVVKGAPDGNYDIVHSQFLATEGRAGFVNLDLANPYDDTVYAVPKYKLGQVIYVRETWQVAGHTTKYYVYRADGVEAVGKWKPSIFMPREAARIFLEVTDVRVERLQDISEQDAVAEGVGRIPIEIAPSPYNDWGGDLDYGYVDYQNRGEFAGYLGDAGAFLQAKDSFASLWNYINGPGSWEANPWVWRYSFKQIETP